MRLSGSRSSKPGFERTRGFTLVELLIVVAIIAILAGLTVAVAAKVAQGGKKASTESVIRVLDQAYASWSLERQAKAPRFFVDEQGTQFPIVDGRFMPSSGTEPEDVEPTLGLLLFSIAESNSAVSMVRGIDPKLVTSGPVSSPAIAGQSVTNGTVKRIKPGSTTYEDRPDGLVIKDAWGKPIRAVVPGFQGGFGEYHNPQTGSVVTQGVRGRLALSVTLTEKTSKTARTIEYRRSYRPFDPSAKPDVVGDGDEGLCAGAAPYFYSTGPDGDPGTRDDNAYAHKPAYPAETAKFNAN